MVLVRLLPLLLLLGCIPKQAPVSLDTAEPITVALVYDASGTGDPTGVSDAMRDAVVAELEARNLRVTLVEAAEFGPVFARRRASGQRLGWLAGEADYALLLETQVGYYNQINGLYRWTVSVRATMQAPDGEPPIDASFEVPVFLRFQHQKASDAMDAARDIVRKRVGRLADTVLGGIDGSAREGPAPDDDGEADSGPGVDHLGPVYFVMVDRFANGDPSNDADADPGDPQAFHGGDLRGVIDKLDYLQGLGVETVWLSPVFRMRTAKISEWGAYHGYWPTGQEGVEPRFGTNADLIELSEGLHARGMKLLLDVVLNHVGYDVPLVSEKPAWFHGRGAVQDWDDPVQATTFDVHGLPDLDQSNPEVVAWIDERVAGWIERYQPDGFRLDAVRHIDLSYWRYFTDRVRALAGEDFVLLGELFEGDPRKLAAAWEAGGFTHMFDFPLYYAATDVFCDGAHPGRVAAMIAQDSVYADPQRLVTFADNHDLPRLASRCDSESKRTRMHTFLDVVRGERAFNYGTEVGMVGAEEPLNRRSMNWGRSPVGLRDLGQAPRNARVGARAPGAVTRVTHLGEDSLGLAVPGSHGWVYGASAPAGPLDGEAVSKPASGGRIQLSVVAGEPLRVVGAHPTLGAWDPAAAPQTAPAGARQLLELNLPGGTVLEYKLVRLAADGSAEWEPRANRYLFVDGDASTDLTWGE